MLQLRVIGADELDALGRRLRRVGRSDLRRELVNHIRAAAKPITVEQKRRVRSLPARGPRSTGLRRAVARSVRLQVRTTGKEVGVRIHAGKRGSEIARMAKHLNRGRWRHPLFGNREHWYPQRVPRGWFDKPAEDAAPRVRAEILEAMEAVKAKIEHGV